MTRRQQRKELLFLVFESTFKQDGIEEIIENAVSARDMQMTEYIENGLHKIVENVSVIDANIEKNLSGWTIGRLPKISLCILRLAIYEMLWCEDIPVGVSINEAVDLAKEFAGDEDWAFVNGVLSSVEKQLGKNKQ